MRKITSFQRRQNRWAKRCAGPLQCDHGGLCGVFEGRWAIANERRWRRTMRRMGRGKLDAKPCVPVPCPPFRDLVLFVTDGADNASR